LRHAATQVTGALVPRAAHEAISAGERGPSLASSIVRRFVIMRILVASDGSQHSEAAIDALLGQPWPAGSTVTVISVLHPPFPMVDPVIGTPLPTYDADKLTGSALQKAQEVAAGVVTRLGAAGFAATSMVRVGDARIEILRAAEEMNADLIMVGSHGRTGIARWLLGSVAEHVVRHATCSVQVARSAKRSA
jgi:nucleotide-binding universal stress UspA family protein